MGDASSLAQHAAALGFQVVVVAPVDDPAGGKISSTAIRAHVAAGRMDAAARLLGRPWAIEGTVVKGAQRGRTIGMPTANVALGDYVRPAFGVYAAQCNVGDGVWRPGVANIGVKPTVGAAPEPLLEVHLFDYADDLYGRGIEVRLHLFLRAERRFESFEALTRQIAEDAAAARRHFGV
jgi:riboflavin kinase/FMN adenylyltransferase